MSDTSLVNEAAWLPSKDSQLRVGSADIVSPASGEILIRNRAWAINPIDWKMQKYGQFIVSYPAVIGCDIAGDVAAIGGNVTRFKVGDRVIAVPLGTVTKKASEGAFQLYTIVPSRCATIIPTEMQYEDAVKLPLGILTATAGLYETKHFSLPPPIAHPHPTGRTLLVWGGSSNVGSAAIQLAIASGVEVVATASSKNRQMVHEIGASKVFDYNHSGIVGDLVDHLRDKTLIGAFDAIGSLQTIHVIADVLERLGGGEIASTLAPPDTIPGVVKVKQVQALSVFLSEPVIGKVIWEDYIPGALQSCQIQPVLKTKIMGRGLERIQAGLDEVRKGLSGEKVIVLA